MLSTTIVSFLLLASPNERPSTEHPEIPPLLFCTDGKTAILTPGSSQPRFFEFDVDGQETWQPGPIFPEGKRVLFLSMEPRRDGPGKPFDEYYTQTPTHIWEHNLETNSLKELITRDRQAPFITPALLIGNDRILVQVVINRVGQIVSMRLDGSDPKPFTKPGEGLPYGLSLSPDAQRVAYHLASSEGYQIWNSNTLGEDRIRVAGHPDHLYFGTDWSPDGQWILYVDCDYKRDPGHDWADICIGKADGSEHRRRTNGQAMWFAATYGDEKSKGGGSNVPSWTRDGWILFPKRLPGSRVAWSYREGKPDLDHFNRDYKPESAFGGSQIVKMHPETGEQIELTPAREGVWDFRATESHDGKWIAFCRAKTGEVPSLWVVNQEGKNQTRVATGINGKGTDHPRWIPWEAP